MGSTDSLGCSGAPVARRRRPRAVGRRGRPVTLSGSWSTGPSGVDLDALSAASRRPVASARRARRSGADRPLRARGVQPGDRADPAHRRAVPPLPRRRRDRQDDGRRRRIPAPAGHARRGRRRRHRGRHRRDSPRRSAECPYDQIERARTVLVWGPKQAKGRQAKPTKHRSPPSPTSRATRAVPTGARASPRRPVPVPTMTRTAHHERQVRLPRRPAADRQGQGHQRRHPARRPRQRPAGGLQAHARAPRNSPPSPSTPRPATSGSTARSSTTTATSSGSGTTPRRTSGASPPRPPSRSCCQRIREAERDLKYEEYAGREGDIVTGIIQQSDNRYTLLDLGKVEALLPQAEQVPYERYEHGARLKAYIVEVRKTTKGPQIVVSRTHPGLIKRLFELEVPEISSGVVEIKAAAREPGHRTKIAVWSNDPNVDPVGRLRGRPGRPGAHGHQRAARREGRHRPVLRRAP